jgi:molybdate transport system regulatory protein
MPNSPSNLKESFPPVQIEIKLWVTAPNHFTLGPGDVRLLKSLLETKNLTKSSELCGYSYKYGWNKLQNLRRKIGFPLIESSRGGYGGGGTITITSYGLFLLHVYDHAQKRVDEVVTQINTEIASWSP